jgi:site-specific DNA-methyltransferase (adenine-specific)
MNKLPNQPTVTLHHADWLEVAALIPPGSIDLIYVDPPFNTGVKQRTPPGASKRATTLTTGASYADAFGTTAQFMTFLRPRVAASVPLLKATGNIIIHVDWRSSHHVRLMLDELLGESAFVNHLIWSYGLGGSSPRRFARKHDDLIVYSARPDRGYFLAPRVAATSQRLAGQTKKMSDVLEVPSLNNMAHERTGYPTQKPLALLELLVKALSPPGGVVFDPCCGSGTTIVAAVRHGRSAIGGDQNAEAIEVAQRRIDGLSSKFSAGMTSQSRRSKRQRPAP